MIALSMNTLEDPDDQEFIRQVYQEYKRLLFSTARKYTSNLADQEDIVQTAIERLIGKVSELRAMNKYMLASYVRFTAKSVSIDFLRKQKRISEHTIVSDSFSPEEENAKDISAFDNTFPTDDALLLLDLWPRLSEEDRILLEGKYIFDFTDKEIAKQLRCKPSSVRMKLTRARRRALTMLSEDGGNEA